MKTTKRNIRVAAHEKRERRHKQLIEIVKENYALVQKGRLACGKALIEIRDDGYWQDTHTTFKDYCAANFDISESYAHRLMEGIKTIGDLPKNLQSRINNEAQARALSGVPEEDRTKAVREASKNGHITAKSIEEAASKIEENRNVQNLPIGKSPVSAGTTPNRGQNYKTMIFDRVGTIVPLDALPYWDRRMEVQKVLTQISKIRTDIKAARDGQDCLWVKHGQDAYEYLSRAYSYISDALPWAVCLQCQGSYSVQPDGCSACGNTGLISEYRFDHFLPKELREIRMKSNQALSETHPESPLNTKPEPANVC